MAKQQREINEDYAAQVKWEILYVVLLLGTISINHTV